MQKIRMQLAILVAAMSLSALAGYQFHDYQQKRALQAASEQVKAQMEAFFDVGRPRNTDNKHS